MEYNNLPKEIQMIVKEKFAFISYCHGNRDVYAKVQKLALYLKNKDIPIVYDEGGLKPGVELMQFENLILDDNCKRVLVVCDKCYLKKVQDNQGGVWREYFNISNDYPDHREKYIPLMAEDDAILPIFKGKVYGEFYDGSQDDLKKIAKVLLPLKKGKKQDKGKGRVEELIKEADLLCNENDYNAADKKITEAIEIYEQQAKTIKADWARLYNLKLYVCIRKQDVKNSVKFANELLDKINDRLDYDKQALYYGNCALAFRMRDNESNEYEECSKFAYQMAQKCGSDELYYYASMYSTALYEMEQFTGAYKIAKEALSEFCSRYKDTTKFTKDNFIMYIKLKGNVAENAIKCSENIYESRKTKLDFLMDAQKSIIDIININNYEKDEKLQLHIYEEATLIFEKLKSFYSF